MAANIDQVVYKGKPCRVEKTRLYLKAGAYTHKTREGWHLVDATTGDVVVDGNPLEHRSAYEYQKPRFQTRKALLAYVEGENEHCAFLAKRRATK